jgi:hypothetical protein
MAISKPGASRTRRWQYSIFSLLLLATVCCILAAIYSRCRRQAEAVTALKSRGFQVFYAGDDIPLEEFVGPTRPTRRLHVLENYFSKSDQRSRGVQVVEGLVGEFGFRPFDTFVVCQHYSRFSYDPDEIDFPLAPETSGFKDHKLETSEFVAIHDLPALRTISVTTDYEISEVVPSIALCKNLEVLHLDAPTCTANDLATVLNLPHLKSLVLTSVDVTDDEVVVKLLSHQRLDELILVKCKLCSGTEAELQQHFRKFTALQCETNACQ